MRVCVPRDSQPDIYEGPPEVLVRRQALTVVVGPPGKRVFIRVTAKELSNLLKEQGK